MKRGTSPQHVWLVVAAAAMLLLTSCGSLTPTSTSAATTTTAASAAGITEPPVPTLDPNKIIIGLDDVPLSWEEQSVATTDSGACLDTVLTGRGFGPASTANTDTAVFSRSEAGPFLIAMVATGVDDVESEFGTLVAEMTACDGTTDSTGFTTSIEPATFNDIGDETFAIDAQISGSNGDVVASYLLAATRVGNTILLVANIITIGNLDSGLVDGTLRTMVDRV